MAFFRVIGFLQKWTLNEKKYIKNTSRNRFKIRDLFLLVEQNRALYFFRPGKIQGKYSYLWHRVTGLRVLTVDSGSTCNSICVQHQHNTLSLTR